MTISRLSEVASTYVVPVVLCVERNRVSFRAVQHAGKAGLSRLLELDGARTVGGVASVLADAYRSRPGVHVAGLLRAGLQLEIGSVPERAVRTIAEAQGRIRFAYQLQKTLGFRDPRELTKQLRSARLFDAGKLTEWVNVLFYVCAQRMTTHSAAEFARAAGDTPSALYRRVRRSFGVGLAQLTSEGPLVLLGRFAESRNAVFEVRELHQKKPERLSDNGRSKTARLAGPNSGSGVRGRSRGGIFEV